MNCKICQELISAWIDNELSSFERMAICEHLDQCSECRELWKDILKIQGKIEVLSEPEMPEGLWNSIEKSLDENRSSDTDSQNIIMLPTAYGRMLSEREENDSCLNIKHSHRLSRSSG
jgi:anti-sigma factor RsiW